MFKIGEFSKLSHVPIKTLRYYDRIGLLKPATVDRFTSYRYYTLDRMRRLNRILALKDLGFSLEQIARVLDEPLSAEQLHGMLAMKEAEVEQVIEDEQARLARIRARLKYIERENTMPDYEIVIKATEPFRAAVVRDVVATYSSVGPLYAEILEALQQAGLTPVGPCGAIYYDEGYKDSDVDVEAYFPISGELPSDERVQTRTITGGEQVASLIRTGPYDDFTPAYQALITWIQDNGYVICGPNREIYLRAGEDGTPPEEWVTEIQFPVMKAT